MSELTVMESAFLQSYARKALRLESLGLYGDLASQIERMAKIMDTKCFPSDIENLVTLTVRAACLDNHLEQRQLHYVLTAIAESPYL